MRRPIHGQHDERGHLDLPHGVLGRAGHGQGRASHQRAVHETSRVAHRGPARLHAGRVRIWNLLLALHAPTAVRRGVTLSPSSQHAGQGVPAASPAGGDAGKRRTRLADVSARKGTTMKVRDRTVSEGDGGSAWGRVRDRSFGPASELPYRRRASDWIRLVVGVVLMSLLLAHQNHETQTELDIFNAVHDLPRGFDSAVRLFYAIGVVWAVVLVVAAVVTRRRRLARDLIVGGVLTWALGRLIGSLVDGSSFARGLDVFVEVKGSQLEFPAVRVAVVVGVIAVATPYLTRPIRRLGQALVLLMFIAAMYLGASQFDDVLAAVALGWTLAAGVHLVFGSPGGRPTTAQVEAALAELGVEVGGLMLALDQPRAI